MRNTALLGIAVCAFAWSATALAQPISSFETEEQMAPFSPGSVQMERVQEHATEGQWALRVFFPGSEKDTWPGITFRPDVDTTQYQVLAFDAYNPGDEPVSLSWRIDLKNGESSFGGESIQPGAPHKVEIWLTGIPAVEKIYPYCRMPRKDFTLYLDNFRWESVGTRFTALHFVDDTPPPTPTAGEQQRGFIIYRRPLTDVVFTNSVPRSLERIETVDAFGTPGEREAATLSLYALRDLGQVSVTVEGLPIEAEVLPVRTLHKRVTYSSKEYIADMPVLCERRESVDIAGGSSKRFVIDFGIAPDATPEVHEGTVCVRVGGAEALSVPMRLRVLPYSLIEPTDMYWGEYYTGPKLANTDEAKIATMKADMADMRANGMTSVGLCFGPPTDTLVWAADDTCSITWDGASLYEHFMDTYAELGYPMPVVLLSDSGQAAAGMGIDDPVTSERWAKRYKAYWSMMQQEQQKRGWPELIVQPVDEPGWQDRAAKDRNVYCLKLLKQIPGMRTEQDGPGDDYFHDEAGPYADMWNYNGSLDRPERIRQIQEDGRIVVIYNCDVESYRPETCRYTAGWFQLASGISGCYNWAYISFHGPPYDDLAGKTGTWMHVYPALGDEPGGPSTGWIGAREGIDDYKYVHTLREAIRRAQNGGNRRAAEAAEEAQIVLEGLIASIDYSERVRSQAGWTVTGTTPDGKKTIGGTLSQATGWDHGEYERARWRVAEATMSVLEALGEIPVRVVRTPASAGGGDLVTDHRWYDARPAAPAQAGARAHQVTIPVWSAGPALDGDLSDPIWQDAARLDPFVLMNGAADPLMQTDVILGSDAATLYLGITCHEDNMGAITARISEDGGRVWEDDCVELYVDANLDGRGYRQVLANSLGTQSWNNSEDKSWRANSRVATKSHTDRWVVEWAIPMADLGLTGQQFGLNVCRERRPMETLELSCWSPTGTGFAVPERFGLASLGQAWIADFQAPPARLGTNTLTVTLANETEEPRRVRAVLLTGRSDGEDLRRLGAGTARGVILGSGRRKTVTHEYCLWDARVPQLTYRLYDVEKPGADPIAERVFTPRLVRPLSTAVRPQTTYLSEHAAAAEFEINLAEDLLPSTQLSLRLQREGDAGVLRRASLWPIEGGRLSVALNLRGLDPGEYRLTAALETFSAPNSVGPMRLTEGGVLPGGPVLAETVVKLGRVRGPFD